MTDKVNENMSLEIYHINCCYDYCHPKDQFIDFKILENGVDVTKRYYGKKPPMDKVTISRISDTICNNGCYQSQMQELGLEDKIECIRVQSKKK